MTDTTTTMAPHVSAQGDFSEKMEGEIQYGIRNLSEGIYLNNVDKGWRGPRLPQRSPAELFMLLVTEVAEGFEAIRDRLPTRAFEYSRENLCDRGDGTIEYQPYDWYENQCDIFSWSAMEDKFIAFSESMEDVRGNTVLGKPIGLASELADVLIRLLDMANEMGIDLGEATLLKHRFNRTRPHRHGGKLH